MVNRWVDYLGQIYAELFPHKLKGLVMIDSPSLQRRYYTAIELWLLKVVGPIYQIYPWKSLLKVGSDGVSTTAYGKQLMLEMMRFMMVIKNDMLDSQHMDINVWLMQ